jgi:hypothetical protein
LRFAVAGQDDGFGGEQIRFARKSFQGLIGPDPGLGTLVQFEEHAHLGCPGGGILGIEFENFGIRAESLLEIRLFEGRLRLALIESLVFDNARHFGWGLFPGLAAELQVDESAHQV